LSPHGVLSSARRLFPLAWPVLVGQLAVLAFSTVDTILVARHASLDLAALAVGSAAYITVFIGLMGMVLAVGPITGQLFGAKRLAEAGNQMHQGVWLALALSVLGSSILAFPVPFLALADATPEVADRVRGYLNALAVALPAALLMTVYRGFNTAVSRPKAVMLLQLGGLALKVPLSALLVSGSERLGIPALGVTGCGIATLVAMWAQAIGAWLVLRLDPFYAPFELRGHGLRAPHRASLAALLHLGVPMGLSILVEVTGFSFMALFISRLGTTPVAGHQIAANVAALLYMVPLALANATSVLVAQRVGAGDMADARRVGWHGLHIGLLIAITLGSAVFLGREGIVRLYTVDEVVIGAALPLLAWVSLFHVGDAAQAVAAFVLRAYRIATVPLVIFALCSWGVGLAGGYAVAFDMGGFTPAVLRGASGFWFMGTVSLLLCGVLMTVFLAWVLRRQHAEPPKTLARGMQA
jgi:MATE family multidrug resistance protein